MEDEDVTLGSGLPEDFEGDFPINLDGDGIIVQQ